jgi:hypothetical protein
MARRLWPWWPKRKKTRGDQDGPLLVCRNCGQSYNPVYILFCARCGEPVPDENGKLPKRHPLDGMGSRGGAVGPRRVEEAAERTGPAQPWLPTQAVEDIVLEYRNRLNDKPQDTDARYNLGLAYFHAGLWEKAAGALQQVVAELPGYADAWTRLAICRARLAETDAALEAAREAVRLEPEGRGPRRILEQLEESLERPDTDI